MSVNRPRLTANGEDLAYITVELVDAGGTPIYDQRGDRNVRVRVSGAGALAGFGNGNPIDASSYQSSNRKTFHGRAVAAIRSGTAAGPIIVDIEGEGLNPQRVQIDAVSPAAR